MKQEREWELCLADQEKPVHLEPPSFRWELVASWPDMPSSRGRGKQQAEGSAPENWLTLPPASGPRVTRLRHSHRNFPLA